MDFDTNTDEYTLVENVRAYVVGSGPGDPTQRERCVELIEKYAGTLMISLDELSDYTLALTAIDMVRQHAVSDNPSIVLAIAAAQQAEKHLDDLFGPDGVQSALCETVQTTKLSFKKSPKVDESGTPKRQSKVAVAREIALQHPDIKLGKLAELLMAELDVNIGYARTMAYNVLTEIRKEKTNG